jgi:hypothetical protein
VLSGLPTLFVKLNGAHRDPSLAHTSVGWTINLQGTAPPKGSGAVQFAAAVPEARHATAHNERKDHSIRLGRDFEPLIVSLPLRRA